MQIRLSKMVYVIFSVFVYIISINTIPVFASDDKIYVFPDDKCEPFLDAIYKPQKIIYMAL